MKTSRYILIAALTVIAASCQDKIAPEQTTNEVIFSASIDSPATKVVLGDAYVGSDNLTHYPMLWHGAEKITIFDSKGQNRYFVGYAQERDEENNRVDVSMASVNFKFDDRYEDGATFELAEGTTYYAVEPYSNKHSLVDGKITQIIANSQYTNPEFGNLPCISISVNDAGTISYGETAMAALAKTTDTYLSFKPTTALIKFTVGNDNVTRVVFKGQDSEVVAGTATFDFTGEQPSLESVASTSNTMYLRIDSNGTVFTKGETYYIAVLPQTLKPQLGFTVSGNTKYKKGGNQITLAPGMILDLGTVEIAF